MNARPQANFNEMFATFHRDIDALPPVVIRVTPRELKHAIIDCDPLSHRDLVDVLMGLAAKVKKGTGSALNDKCAGSVASMLADIADVVEQDLVNQQEEADWLLQTR
jgi:hypothetical protein